MKKTDMLNAGLRRVEGMIRERIYIASGLDVTLPETIRLEVTQRCNYKCRYCHYWQLDEYPEEMSIDEWKSAIIDIREAFGSQHIKFVGGEPFVKKGFVDLLDFCGREGILWGAITNGSALSQKNVERICQANPTHIDISVDSASSDINDYLRGIPGALENVSSGIKRLVSERTLTKSSFVVRIKPTISRLNLKEMIGIVALSETVGADLVDFHPVHTIPFWTKELHHELLPTESESEELRRLVEEVIAAKRSGAPIETSESTLRSYPDQFLGRPVPHNIQGPCRVGMRDFIVSANGDVSMCFSYPSIGNIRKTKAKDIWRGSVGSAIRAETTSCGELGGKCANTCLDHRSFVQEVKRGMHMMRISKK